MARFKVEWTEEVWYRTEVEADNEFQAKEKLLLGEVDLEKAKVFGSELQDSVTAEEIS